MTTTIWRTSGVDLPSPAVEYDEVLTRAMDQAARDPRTPHGEMLFWAFVVMRQNAWYRKEVLRLPPPWTADPIINEWRFTNIYRELDRGTLFLCEQVLEQYDGSQEQMAMLVALYRAFNRIDTWLDLVRYLGGLDSTRAEMDSYKCKGIYEFFDEAQRTGRKVFTGAYMMTSMAKLFHYKMLPSLVDAAVAASKAPGLKAATNTLAAVQYLGKFSAFQMAMDMAIPVAQWKGLGVLSKVSLDNHVEVGPGSGTGARLVRKDLPPLTTMRYLRENQYIRVSLLSPGPWTYPRRGDGTPEMLRIIDIEHALCEYGKYVNALNGGRMKSRLATPASGARLWNPTSPVPPGWGDWYRRGNK